MLDDLFRPRSIAVIGASAQEGKVGRVIMDNLLASGFPGAIYPVNPRATEILGIQAYPDIAGIGHSPDMAVIIIPAQAVPEALQDCADGGVKIAVIISAGFKEAGHEGLKLERRLMEIVADTGIRVLGPNCLGLLDTKTPFNVTFATTDPLPGHVAFFSQSGALCTSALDWSISQELGFSKFISIGNKADLNEVHLLQALADDENSRVIAGYLEGIEDGAAFIEVAREASRRKPIVIFKAGVTEAGIKAVSSHTGTLAGSEKAYDCAFAKAGIIRAKTVEDLFQISRLAARQPIPQGRRFAIVTNAGGPGIIAADALENAGMRMAGLAKRTTDKLREALPAASNIYNPVDVLGDARAGRYAEALEAVCDDPAVNAVMVILTPQAMTEPLETARAITSLERRDDLTLVTVFMGGASIEEAERELTRHLVPNFRFPEDAARALAALADYQERIGIEESEVPQFEADRERVRSIFDIALADDRLQLVDIEARDVFEAYGIKTARTELATNLNEAIEIGRRMGYPVVMKIASPQILHKTDVGGVIVGIDNTDRLIEAYEEITANARRLVPNAEIWGVSIQEMLPPAKEMVVGMSRDPQFGPLVMCGLGGVYVEVLKDVSFRLAPVTKRDALQMLTELGSYTLLKGARGEPPADTDCVVNVIGRVSQLVTDFPDIMEIDVNPLRVYEKGKGCLAADARLVLGA
ncbi:MAG: acetate--CoA ligase alpha subunit [Candidatus Geothermincolia bacterium]